MFFSPDEGGGAIKQSARLTRDCLPPAAQGPRICRYGACQKGGAQICTLLRIAICRILLRDLSRLLSTPGVEPGLSRPQHDVLTTRRCGLLAAEVLLQLVGCCNKSLSGRLRPKANLRIKGKCEQEEKGEMGLWMLHLSFLCKSVRQLSMQSSAVQ